MCSIFVSVNKKGDFKMTVQKENKIGDVVAENFYTARIFEKYGLDFCCGGKKSIFEACLENGIDQENLLTELSGTNVSNANSIHFDKWEVDFLIDYIVNNHHCYVAESIPTIEHHIQKVLMAHGEKHPEIAEINAEFNGLKEELIAHMQKEEKMLFPYIKKMQIALKNTFDMSIPPFGTVRNPVNVMEHEHENAGIITKKIRGLSNNYTPPADACNTYKVLYNELREFENDLHTHVHLENNILFPKAIELEKLIKLINKAD